MAYTITLIPGDGSGPDITVEAKRCIDATGVQIEWETVDAGLEALEKTGSPLPKEVLDSIAKNRIALKGPITTPSGSGYRSINVQLRQYFELFACLRPCKTIKGIPGAAANVDLVVVRENTEDLYAGIEFKEGQAPALQLIELVRETMNREIPQDSAVTLKPISHTASKRIAQFAFNYAADNQRKRITVVTKANIMKFTDGLFYEEAEKTARSYPQIELEHLFIDNFCMHLAATPQNYELILASNLYGDIISDLCAAFIGGLGMAPGANIGEECAIFEAVHGSAPKYKGKNVMNPCALILSGVMMLRHLGETRAADRLQHAIEAVIGEGRYVTRDLNRQSYVGTKEMTDRILYYME